MDLRRALLPCLSLWLACGPKGGSSDTGTGTGGTAGSSVATTLDPTSTGAPDMTGTTGPLVPEFSYYCEPAQAAGTGGTTAAETEAETGAPQCAGVSAELETVAMTLCTDQFSLLGVYPLTTGDMCCAHYYCVAPARVCVRGVTDGCAAALEPFMLEFGFCYVNDAAVEGDLCCGVLDCLESG